MLNLNFGPRWLFQGFPNLSLWQDAHFRVNLGHKGLNQGLQLDCVLLFVLVLKDIFFNNVGQEPIFLPSYSKITAIYSSSI